METDFESAKQRVLHLANVLIKANTSQELRALLLSDTQAPYHSYDMIDLLMAVENIGNDVAEHLGVAIDEVTFKGGEQA